MPRCLLPCVLLTVLMTASSCGGDGPLDAASFTYEVAYGEPSIIGQARVTFTAANGEEVTQTVSLPWESEPIRGDRGSVLPASCFRSPA